ncbi:unnamed protein product [Pleuronectes platessa]|uniref:Uncharacterized protein n=1 Tax=Pleuronectes platessa TaxID=8262 RepID=A0A9N7YCT9_PLEPL|nr:unnamed protein product [Pleuronectes platessa]
MPSSNSCFSQPQIKLNQRRSLAHCGGLSVSLSLSLHREHQQPPGSAPQDSLRPSPKACISHRRRTLLTRPSV